MALKSKQGSKVGDVKATVSDSKGSIDISTGDVLTVVSVLRMLFGRDPKMSSLLSKVDTPSEIEAVTALIQRVLTLVD